MKSTVLSVLACVVVTGARASECSGPNCVFDGFYSAPVAPAVSAPSRPVAAMPAPAYGGGESVWNDPSLDVSLGGYETAELHHVDTVRTFTPQPIYVKQPEPKLQPARFLSVQRVPADSRAPLWDGTRGNYRGRSYDKTVDGRDGVPIWDDSISNYRDKDFSDWFLEQRPEVYIDYDGLAADAARQNAATSATAAAKLYGTPSDDQVIAMYAETMQDAATTLARVEELLAPSRPSGNLWLDDGGKDVLPLGVAAVANVSAVADTPAMPVAGNDAPTHSTTVIVQPVIADNVSVSCDSGTGPCGVQRYASAAVSAVLGAANDGCPFDTDAECAIWRKKPMVRESVSPRSSKIRADKVDEFVAAVQCNANITANDAVAAPLLARYKMLMQAAAACCTDGMTYALRQAGASDGLVYKFLADDANFYGFGTRCLMMSDNDLDTKYPNTATAAVAADVRNGCLCRGREWFASMLAPFQQVYAAAPEFANMTFFYTYRDGLNREVQVSVNNDVRNVLNQLAQCP